MTTQEKTVTFAIMDPPFESARTATAPGCFLVGSDERSTHSLLNTFRSNVVFYIELLLNFAPPLCFVYSSPHRRSHDVCIHNHGAIYISRSSPDRLH